MKCIDRQSCHRFDAVIAFSWQFFLLLLRHLQVLHEIEIRAVVIMEERGKFITLNCVLIWFGKQCILRKQVTLCSHKFPFSLQCQRPQSKGLCIVPMCVDWICYFFLFTQTWYFWMTQNMFEKYVCSVFCAFGHEETLGTEIAELCDQLSTERWWKPTRSWRRSFRISWMTKLLSRVLTKTWRCVVSVRFQCGHLLDCVGNSNSEASGLASI